MSFEIQTLFDFQKKYELDGSYSCDKVKSDPLLFTLAVINEYRAVTEPKTS